MTDTKWGITISQYQGNITWTDVYGAGIDDVRMRATMGENLQDSKVIEYWNGCGNCHSRGIYHVYKADHTIMGQVYNINNTTKQLTGFDTETTPLILSMSYTQDHELAAANQTRMEDRTTHLHNLTQELDKNGYHNIQIYCSVKRWKEVINTKQFLDETSGKDYFSKYGAHLAHWHNNQLTLDQKVTTGTEPFIPDSWKFGDNVSWLDEAMITSWEYTSQGQIPGISGNVCLNLVKDIDVELSGGEFGHLD